MRRFGRVIPVLSLGALLALVPVGARAQVSICADPSPDRDFDGDGFSDAAEAAGLTLATGLAFVDRDGNEGGLVPSCCGVELPRSECVEPASADLFALVNEAEPSGLPADLFAPLTEPVAEGGLGVTVHRLVDDRSADNDSRVVAPQTSLADEIDQSAVQLTELLDTRAEILGIANYGTPNNLDRARIWTARIRRFVEQECGGDPECQTDQGDVGVDAITRILTRWVGSHETGHMARLTAEYERRFGGYHEKSGSGIVMEQFPVVQTRGKTPPTFFIPGAFSELSAADKRLK